MKLDLREKIASIINILISILSLAGIILLIINHKSLDMKYFSTWVSLITLISSILYILKCYFIKNTIFKYITLVIKYITVGSSLLLLLVSILILVPMNNFNFYDVIIKNENILLILINPIIVIISYSYFESYGDYRLTSGLYNTYYVMLYSIIVTLLVGFKNIASPYFIYDFTKFGIFQILAFNVIFIGLAYISSGAMIKLNYLLHKNHHIEGEILSDNDDIEETPKNVLSDEEKELMKEQLRKEILEEIQKENEEKNNLDK
jgi:hypothetical protein